MAIDQDGEGDVADQLVEYTAEQNLQHATRFLTRYRGEQYATEQASMIQQLANYPDAFLQAAE